ncbi:MAG: hypothetical protein R2713_00745 [Ilumatobacteraceae bacterium]
MDEALLVQLTPDGAGGRLPAVIDWSQRCGRRCGRSPTHLADAPVSWRIVRIDVFTIFPALVDGFCSESLLGKCRSTGLLDLRLHVLREHTTDVHRSVDGAPFGGGAGMVMKPEPIFASVEHADPPRPLFLLGPGGRRFDQAMADELAAIAAGGGFSLLCGRYEGHRSPRA